MSKELEALRMLEQVCLVANVADMSEQINLIETALKDYEKRLILAKEYQDINNVAKRLKALEIIKKIVKIVDYSDHTIANGNLVILQGGEIKTKDEYDLLKEVIL